MTVPAWYFEKLDFITGFQGPGVSSAGTTASTTNGPILVGPDGGPGSAPATAKDNSSSWSIASTMAIAISSTGLIPVEPDGGPGSTPAPGQPSHGPKWCDLDDRFDFENLGEHLSDKLEDFLDTVLDKGQWLFLCDRDNEIVIDDPGQVGDSHTGRCRSRRRRNRAEGSLV